MKKAFLKTIPGLIMLVALFGMGGRTGVHGQTPPPGGGGVADEFPPFEDHLIPGLEQIPEGESPSKQSESPSAMESGGDVAQQDQGSQSFSEWFWSLFQADRTFINLGIVVLLLILFLFYRLRSGGSSRRSYF